MTNTARFQYTGQLWIPEVGLYSYKARMYSPTLGRFMQTDPIGYADDYNLYAYVGNDPVNGIDPSGMADNSVSAVAVTGCRSDKERDIWNRCIPIPVCPPSVCCIAEVQNCQAPIGSPGNPAVPPGGGGGGNGKSPQTPENPACMKARNTLDWTGGQIKAFGQGLEWSGLGLDLIGILGDEAGAGEALQAGATSAA